MLAPTLCDSLAAYLTDTANYTEIAGTLVGILYLYWEYRADDKLWLAGIVMPAISLAVYWQSGLYADFGINVYYLLAAVYGLYAWRRSNRQTFEGSPKHDACPTDRQPAHAQGLPITHCTLRQTLLCIALSALCFVVIGLVLVRFTNSDVPWWDAFTTALSIVGMWMLARKWLEQWLAWIAVDAVSSGLYVYKGIYFYAALYGVYTIVAIFGYYAWKRLMIGSQK